MCHQLSHDLAAWLAARSLWLTVAPGAGMQAAPIVTAEGGLGG
jgi:hypothetical protein